MHHHLITHRPAWTPSSHRPCTSPRCCRSSHTTTVSHQIDPPPHISAPARAHSRVLDTDLTPVAWQVDGQALPVGRSCSAVWLDAALTVLRSLQKDQSVCAMRGSIPGHQKLFWWARWVLWLTLHSLSWKSGSWEWPELTVFRYKSENPNGLNCCQQTSW